jgi:ketosteroid isomerase-like protein
MRKAILSFIAIAGLILGLSSCKPGAQNSFSEADKEAIKSTSTGAVKSLNETKDIKAYVNTYYAENAIVLMPNVEPVVGREAIINANQPFSDSKMDIIINDINGENDLAYVYGNYNLVSQPGGFKDNGKYIEIWKKQADGKWQVVYDIWNSSLPVQSDTTQINN